MQSPRDRNRLIRWCCSHNGMDRCSCGSAPLSMNKLVNSLLPALLYGMTLGMALVALNLLLVLPSTNEVRGIIGVSRRRARHREDCCGEAGGVPYTTNIEVLGVPEDTMPISLRGVFSALSSLRVSLSVGREEC